MPEVQFQYQLEHEGQTITYNVNPQHREKDNPNKSIWIVKPDVEYACFKFSYEKEWVVEKERGDGYLFHRSVKHEYSIVS